MILLKELLADIEYPNKDDMIHVENWRLAEAEYLSNMGFDFLDDYKMGIDKDPFITIYKKENPGKEKNKPITYFVVEVKNKSNKQFKNFEDVINYFDNFEQEKIDKRK